MNRVLFSLFIFISIAQSSFSESIFLKNGEIIEGSVTKEDKDQLYIKQADANIKILDHVSILRILYSYDYKKRMHIYLKSGEILEGHIVDENIDFYIYRTDLNSNQEFKIKKSMVKVISEGTLTQVDFGLKIQTGSGALAAAGIYFQIKAFELFLAPGIIYVDQDEETYKAMPFKIQLSFYFMDLGQLRPYLFANSAYVEGLQYYESRFGIGGGVGILAYKYFFVEGSYQSVFKKSGLTIGLGLKFPVTSF